jgi:small subunit ribosomal protein S9
VAPPATATAPAQPGAGVGRQVWGVGRRKTSVARVRVRPGKGKLLINKRELDRYFTEITDRRAVLAPLEACEQAGKWDVFVNVRGGGHTGQAGAIRLGVARALLKCDAKFEPALRDGDFLTRDSRKVERKKYGQSGARRRFQFSKR